MNQLKNNEKTASQKALLSNIPKNILFNFLMKISLTDAIWMLFLAYRGMSLVQIGLLESIYHVTALLMELPTGIVADRFGRRLSRILGRTVALFSTLIMFKSHSFELFAVAFVFSAIGNNLESGAGDALVYDSMLEAGTAEAYMKVRGWQEVAFQSASLGSMIIGGYIATYSYELAYLITFAIHGVTIAQAFTFVEPSIGKIAYGKERPSLRRHMRESSRAILENRHVLLYMIFIETFALFFTTLHFYLQNYMKSMGLKEAMIGLVMAAASLASLALSTRSHKMERRYGRKVIIRIGAAGALICLFGIAFTPFVPAFYVGLAAVDGVLYIAFSDYINQLIPSSCRATLLSFQAMLFSMMMIVLFPVVGWVAQVWGFRWAFEGIFALALPMILFTLWALENRLEAEQPLFDTET